MAPQRSATTPSTCPQNRARHSIIACAILIVGCIWKPLSSPLEPQMQGPQPTPHIPASRLQKVLTNVTICKLSL